MYFLLRRWASAVCELVMLSTSRIGWVYSGYSAILPHRDRTNTNIGANEMYAFKLYILCRIR